MSYDDARMKILVSGLTDWVSLDEARSLVQITMPTAREAEVRETTLATVGDLLGRRLACAGDLPDDYVFRPWTIDAAGTVEEIASRWTDLNVGRWIGICWFRNTPEGDALARPVSDALGEPDDES